MNNNFIIVPFFVFLTYFLLQLFAFNTNAFNIITVMVLQSRFDNPKTSGKKSLRKSDHGKKCVVLF